jgi:hypothetical protein
VLLVANCAFASAPSLGEQSVSLRAAFAPKRPGQETTAEFTIQIAAAAGRVPPPLTQASVRYPAGLGIPLSGLGIDACARQTLEVLGAVGCPAGSFMGEGSAVAEIPLGPDVLREKAHISLVRTPEQGQLAMFFFIDAEETVNAQVILDGMLAPASRPYGGRLDIAVPLVTSTPEAPDVAVVQIHLVLGPRGLTYYEHIAGKLVPYHPRGLRLPTRCPRGGYPFALALGFADGSSGRATALVPCPRTQGRR